MHYRQPFSCQLDFSYLDSQKIYTYQKVKVMGSYVDSPESLHTYQKTMDDSNPGWRELYENALLELEREKLLQYVELAEQAIRKHVSAQAESGDDDPRELQAMQDALHALSLLRRTAIKE